MPGLLDALYGDALPIRAELSVSGASIASAAAYGFLRIAIAKFPEPAQDFQVPILALAAVGLVYGSLLAFRAPDFREAAPHRLLKIAPAGVPLEMVRVR